MQQNISNILNRIETLDRHINETLGLPTSKPELLPGEKPLASKNIPDFAQILHQARQELSPRDNRWLVKDAVSQAHQITKLDPELLQAVIEVESAGNPHAQSSVGAKGLMQLMDQTAKDLGVHNSFDPYENVLGGARYLSEQLQAFKGNLRLALAAYNAGPDAVRKYNDIPPYSETQDYVQKVLRAYQRAKLTGG